MWPVLSGTSFYSHSRLVEGRSGFSVLGCLYRVVNNFAFGFSPLYVESQDSGSVTTIIINDCSGWFVSLSTVAQG